MSAHPSSTNSRSAVLVVRSRDDEDEEQFKPLEWGLMRRLFGYTHAVAAKRNWLIVLTIIRAAQLPALVWISTLVIKGPITEGNLEVLGAWVVLYAVLAITTDGIFHFRQRFAL